MTMDEQSTDEVFSRVSSIWFEVTLNNNSDNNKNNNNNSMLLLSRLCQTAFFVKLSL